MAGHSISTSGSIKAYMKLHRFSVGNPLLAPHPTPSPQNCLWTAPARVSQTSSTRPRGPLNSSLPGSLLFLKHGERASGPLHLRSLLRDHSSFGYPCGLLPHFLQVSPKRYLLSETFPGHHTENYDPLKTLPPIAASPSPPEVIL